MGVLIALPLALAGCKEDSECEKVCSRVSRCRQEARVGEPILGERKLPPDSRCMKRCQEDREHFETCELKMRSCESLRTCYGELR